ARYANLRGVSLRELAAFVLLSALWGGSFIFIRVAVPDLGPIPLMAGRVSIAAVALGLVDVVLRRRLQLGNYWRGLLVLGSVNAAIPFSFIAAAELHLTASLASILNATVPMFAAVVSAIWLKDRLSGKQVVGLFLGLVGVGVLVGWSPLPLDLRTILSVAAMFGAALCYALGTVYARKNMASAPTFTLAIGQQASAALWLLVPAVWLTPTVTLSADALWALLGLGLLSTALAYLLYFFLLARVGPTKTVSVTYLVPVFGVIWGATFLREPITAGMIAGLAIIAFSLVLVTEVPIGRLNGRR